MYAKKIFDFTAKPFSHFSTSFSSFTSFFSVNTTKSDTNDQDFSQSNSNGSSKEYYYYQIQSSDYLNGNEKWLGNQRNSHFMTSKYPCKIIQPERNSLLLKVLGNWSQLRRNCLKNRVATIQYAANNPIEDRLAFNQINDVEGYILNVFDGYGGWQLAEFAMENLPRKFQKYISSGKEVVQKMFFPLEKIITNCLNKGYDSIENGFLKIARKAKSLGLLKTGSVGMYALSVFVHDNNLYVANSGSCKGFLCNLSDEGIWGLTKINSEKKNQNNTKERNLKDIEYKEKNKILGFYSSKYRDFIDEKNIKSEVFTHNPNIEIVEIKENDRFLILGTKGLWNVLKKRDLKKLLEFNVENINKMCENIFQWALDEISSKNGINKEELLEISLGSDRKKIHDDISIMIVDLTNQYR